MTEQDTTTLADTPPEQEITFHDRLIWVRFPSPEQLLVWQRTLTQLQKSKDSGWNAENVMKALDRACRIIGSVIVHDTDKEWLDDQMLDGSIGLMEAAQIIQLSVDKFVETAEAQGNREDRRKVAKRTPAKKAVRKAPAR